VDSAGTVYVSDFKNNTIRKIANGTVSTLPSAQLNEPIGVAVDSVGNVYVADASNNIIRKITPSGTMSTLAVGFKYPTGVAIDSAGLLYVADSGNHAIRTVTSSGVVNTLAGGSNGNQDGWGSSASFNYPYGVAVTSSGIVYVADRSNNMIRRIENGYVMTIAGSNNSGSSDGTGASASFSNPESVAVDSAGIVYVADHYNNAVRKITIS